MFVPPRCPNPLCPQHISPTAGFYRRKGHYFPKCRPWPVPRFSCRSCRRSFSRQTFRMDYRDHRPDLNPFLVLLLASGLGLRQSSRLLQLSLRCTELKFRKVASHLRRLNLNLRAPLARPARFHFDEFETYEGRRAIRPLTLPVVIETDSRFLVWSEAAPIRPRGKLSEKRLRAQQQDCKRFGPRRDRSRAACLRALRRAAALCPSGEHVRLYTDEKATYPTLARRAFGDKRLVHSRVSGELARTHWNPLFPINHAEALMRDLMGRLRRDSWLVSKQRRFLDLHLQLFAAWRNFVRRRFNWDPESPAQRLGFAPRRLSAWELLSWRQDWRGRSVHPLSSGALSIATWRAQQKRLSV